MSALGPKFDNLNERKLAKLEKKYEPDTEYRRRMHADIKAAKQLLRDGAIDHPHCELLIEQIEAKAKIAHSKYETKKFIQKRREQEQAMLPTVKVCIIGFAIFVFLMLKSCGA